MNAVVADARTPVASRLRSIQAPVQAQLDDVVRAMHAIATDDLPLIREVSGHLLQMRGKMFRPSVVRSITRSAARALIVIGPRRFSFTRIENWVVRNPLGARHWS